MIGAACFSGTVPFIGMHFDLFGLYSARAATQLIGHNKICNLVQNKNNLLPINILHAVTYIPKIKTIAGFVLLKLRVFKNIFMNQI
jgi:hypothetical protein